MTRTREVVIQHPYPTMTQTTRTAVTFLLSATTLTRMAPRTATFLPWVVVGLVFLILTGKCPSVHLKVRTGIISNGVVVLCILFSMPFFAHTLLGAKSWTGMALSPKEKRRIEGPPGHVVGMFLWLFLSFFQLVFYKSLPRLHKVVGRILFLVILPACLFEICTNAVHIFLPNKPMYLARHVLGKQDVGLAEIVAFSNVFSVPLTVPVGVGLHAYFGAQAIWPTTGGNKRNILLHQHHMFCAIIWMLSAGMIRWFLKVAFVLEWGGCREHTGNPLDAIPTQAAMCLPTGIILVATMNILYMTLSPTLKQDSAVESMRLFWIWYVMHMIISSAIFGVKITPNCKQ